MFTRDNLPPVGHELTTLSGHDYTLAAVLTHTTKTKLKSYLLDWRTACASCGSPVTVLTALSFSPRSLKSRCDRCLMADYGCVGVERSREVQRRYGEAQRASHAEAALVRSGAEALKPRALIEATLSPEGDRLDVKLAFNDRKRRSATFKGGKVRCAAARDCDYSAFELTLAKILEQQVRLSLY